MRPLSELWSDPNGSLTTEYMLLTMVLVMPLAILEPKMLDTLSIYYYRMVGPVMLPFV